MKAINTSIKVKYKLCEICGTYTVKSDGCINSFHFINSKLKNKKK